MPRRLTLTYSFGLCPWSGLGPQHLRPEAEPGAQPQTFLLSFPAGPSPASHRAAKPERTIRELRL